MRGFIARYKVECAILLLVAVIFSGRAWMAWPSDPVGSEAMRWSRDADPWLRLTLVRDWLEGGSWYDHGMKHSNAPEGGIESPWTRPLDVVIAGVAQLVDGDRTVRFIRAALLLPGIWALLCLWGMIRAARRLLPHPDHVLILMLTVALMPMMWNYFNEANADHHAPLAALFIWVLGTIAGPRLTFSGAIFAGALLGLMLWISPEALFIIALVLAVSGMRWFLYGESLRPVWLLSLSLTSVVLLAVLIERRPDVWFLPLYDSVSIVHVVALSLVSAVLSVLYYRPVRWLAIMLTGLAAVILWGLYPDFYRGMLVGTSPYIEQVFLPKIKEATPLWQQAHWMDALALLWQPVLALLAVMCLVRSRPPRVLMPQGLTVLAVFLPVLFLLVMIQMRWYYYLAPVMALALSSVIAPLMRPDHALVAQGWPARMIVGEPQGVQVFVRQLALALVVGVPLLLMVLAPDTGARTYRGRQSAACETLASMWIRNGGMQATLGARADIVLAPTNLGTQILFYTPYRIIASNYHREGEGIQYVWESFSVTKTEELQAYLAARAVDTLVLCPEARAPKGSVLMQIYQGEAPIPAWMERVGLRSMPEWRGLPKKNNEPMLLRIKN